MTAPVQVRIELPLPLDVASTLMSVIGTVYPGAMIRTDGPSHLMTMEIPDAERRAKVPVRKVKAALTTADEHADADVLSIGEKDGKLDLTVSTPEEASTALAEIAVAMLEADGATNYLEAECRDVDGNRYVVCAARSKGQTPHALRMKAEARADAAEAKLAAMEAQ